MKSVLLTGATGFIGQNILPILLERFHVFTPSRTELDLRDGRQVRRYFAVHNIDVVFHCANPNPAKNPAADYEQNMAEDSLRLFLNLFACRDDFGKMIYLGSGAEYDKRLEIQNIPETECFRSVPKDAYGFAKYAMNTIAARSGNIYNLCVFGCFGPGDHFSKFITHCIRCCLREEPITIRQDCKFDYIYATDLGRMLVWMGENTSRHHMYNASGRAHTFLSEIAEEVRRQMESKQKIQILMPGLNREYTADGERFWKESGLDGPTPLKEGITLQIQWEKEHFQT